MWTFAAEAAFSEVCVQSPAGVSKMAGYLHLRHDVQIGEATEKRDLGVSAPVFEGAVTLAEGRPRAHSQSVERSDAIVGSMMVIGEACKFSGLVRERTSRGYVTQTNHD